MAQHLKQHPGISGPDGLPYHEALTKETHFFEGVLGRRHASSPTLYRSFFPTVVAQWWAQAVRGVPNVRASITLLGSRAASPAGQTRLTRRHAAACAVDVL